jgi:hypothetical protein
MNPELFIKSPDMFRAGLLKIEQLERLKQQMVKVLIRRKVFQKQRYRGLCSTC